MGKSAYLNSYRGFLLVLNVQLDPIVFPLLLRLERSDSIWLKAAKRLNQSDCNVTLVRSVQWLNVRMKTIQPMLYTLVCKFSRSFLLNKRKVKQQEKTRDIISQIGCIKLLYVYITTKLNHQSDAKISFKHKCCFLSQREQLLFKVEIYLNFMSQIEVVALVGFLHLRLPSKSNVQRSFVWCYIKISLCSDCCIDLSIWSLQKIGCDKISDSPTIYCFENLFDWNSATITLKRICVHSWIQNLFEYWFYSIDMTDKFSCFFS